MDAARNSGRDDGATVTRGIEICVRCPQGGATLADCVVNLSFITVVAVARCRCDGNLAALLSSTSETRADNGGNSTSPSDARLSTACE